MYRLLQPGRIIAGKYLLDRELARGGMGSLWVAFDQQLRRHVAVKFIRPTAAQHHEAHVRFEREARAAASIRSSHVVQTYEYAMESGHAFLVMELLEGEDLGAMLERERRVPLARASKLLIQIAKGLDAVHAAAIIHRDMKPGNIFLSVVRGEETVKLIDFGAARLESRYEPRTTGPGAIIGTLHYMAPEQTRGETTLDHRVDLWALAVILYRLITGERPFAGASVNELIRSICTAPVRPPSHLVPELPAGIDIFFQRAFARPLQERFSTALDLSHAFFTASTSERAKTLRWRPRAVRPEEPFVDAVTIACQRTVL